LRFENMGPSNHMSFLLDPKTSCGVMDTENHQGSITPYEVLGPPKHMRF
jgi:hypothetical protein